mgnify:CR=1 FL=1
MRLGIIKYERSVFERIYYLIQEKPKFKQYLTDFITIKFEDIVDINEQIILVIKKFSKFSAVFETIIDLIRIQNHKNTSNQVRFHRY